MTDIDALIAEAQESFTHRAGMVAGSFYTFRRLITALQAERALSDRLLEALNYVGDIADDDLNGGAVNYEPRLKAIEGFARAALTAHTEAQESGE